MSGGASSSTTQIEPVRVVVRARPFNAAELEINSGRVIQIHTQACQISLTNPANPQDLCKSFSYDLVYDEATAQATIYEETAFSLVDSVMEGFNGTIFAYGQTGCGKTFTMQGDLQDSDLCGIMPRSFEHVFGVIEAAGSMSMFLIVASYLEIYNEEIHDLLSNNPKQRLDLKEHPETGPYVKDLTKKRCGTVQDVERHLARGMDCRSVGATAMNENSSRSHSIFCLYVERCDREDGEEQIRAAKLNMVDLAGSERQGKTKASGDRLREATMINLSLSALGNVISALVDGKTKNIPFRDSKLTRLLHDSLGGNTKTIIVSVVSPAAVNYDETLSTLRYASRAKNIKNKPVINADPKDAMLKELQQEVARLQGQLEQCRAGEDPHSDRRLNDVPSRFSENTGVQSALSFQTSSEDDDHRLPTGESLGAHSGRRAGGNRVRSGSHDELLIDEGVDDLLPYIDEDWPADDASPLGHQQTLGSSVMDRPPPIDREFSMDALEGMVPLDAREISINALEDEPFGMGMDQFQSYGSAADRLVLDGSEPSSSDQQSKFARRFDDERRTRQRLEEENQLTKERLQRAEELQDSDDVEDLERELEEARHRTGKLEDQIQDLQGQLVGGGANKAKASSQSKWASKVAKQREVLKHQKQAITDAEERMMMVDQEYQSLQEEAREKTQIISKLRLKYRQNKAEVKDIQREFEAEKSEFLDTLRESRKELQIYRQISQMVLNPEKLKRVAGKARWDEEAQVWNLPHIAVQSSRVKLPQLSEDEDAVSSDKSPRHGNSSGSSDPHKSSSRGFASGSSKMGSSSDRGLSEWPPHMDNSPSNRGLPSSGFELDKTPRDRMGGLADAWADRPGRPITSRERANGQNGNLHGFTRPSGGITQARAMRHQRLEPLGGMPAGPRWGCA